jgi:putative ATP-binding cassette transporter
VLWRQWLSQRLLALYLRQRAYYSLNTGLDTGLTVDRNAGQHGRPDQATAWAAATATEIDNPDQRISQDTASFTGTSLSVAVGILEAVLSFFSFIVVLWTINSRLALLLIIYAVFGTTLVLLASGRLVALNGEQLRLEADFRYGLVRLRDDAESRSSIRSRNRLSVERANSQAKSAVRRLPRCSLALGLGANRPSGIARFRAARRCRPTAIGTPALVATSGTSR